MSQLIIKIYDKYLCIFRYDSYILKYVLRLKKEVENEQKEIRKEEKKSVRDLLGLDFKE